MKKDTIIEIVIAIILLIALCILIPFTAKSIKENNNPMNNLGMPGGQNNNVSYSAGTEITKDTTITSGEYESSKADENVILVSGNIKANLSNIDVKKTGDSNGGDNTSFYGTNSAILAKDGATLTLKNITIETNGKKHLITCITTL